MAEKILAVFDSNANYTERFVGYLSGKKRLPFRTIGFSKLNALADYAQRRNIDILLIGELPYKTHAGRSETDIFEALESKDAGSRFEEETTFEYLESLESTANFKERVSQDEIAAYAKKFRDVGKILFLDEIQAPHANPGHINKYRSMEKILADILTAFRYENAEAAKTESFLNAEVYCVYSPEGSITSQGFAIAVAHALSENGRVLYMNFERFSGLSDILKTDVTLSDLIYFFEEKKDGLSAGVRQAAVNVGGFECIFASEDVEDVSIIENSEWESFIASIEAAGGYEIIVLDIGETFQKPEVIFEICEKIYVPYTSGRLQQKKLEQLNDWVMLKGGERLSEKFVTAEIDADEIISEYAKADYPECCFGGEYSRIVSKKI